MKQLIFPAKNVVKILVMTWCLLNGIIMPSSAQQANNTFPVKVIRNIRYAPPPDSMAADTSSDRLLDAYLPQVKGRLPVFVFVHGGGFSGGDKKQVTGLCTKIASQGIAVLSINYRLYLKHHKIPGASAGANMAAGVPATGAFNPGLQHAVEMAAEDAGAVFSWVKAHGKEYDFNTRKVAICGGSAGAMTALYTAYASGQHILPVGAVVNLWGGLADAAVIGKKAPPLLTFHGEDDKLINVAFAYALDNRMKQQGNISDLRIMKGKGHAAYKEIEMNFVPDVAAFVRRHLR